MSSAIGWGGVSTEDALAGAVAFSAAMRAGGRVLAAEVDPKPDAPPHLAHEWGCLTEAERADVLAWAAGQVRAETLREAGRRALHDEDEMPEDEAAGLWMVIVHDGDTGRGEDWQEAFAVARETRAARPDPMTSTRTEWGVRWPDGDIRVAPEPRVHEFPHRHLVYRREVGPWSPFELAHDDRMTWEVSVVTCGGHVTEADGG